MSSEPQQPRGRHARPPSRAAVLGERALAAALSEEHRRAVVVAGGGAVCALVLAVTAAVVLPGDDGPAKATSVAASDRRAGGTGAVTKAGAGAAAVHPSPAGETLVSTDPDEDLQAVAYFRQQDPDDEIVKHVEEVRESGAFLRVYTDLKEDEENSKPAISLCEWATDYLRDHRSDRAPIVFIHAKESDNGHVVLANRDSDKDSCRVGETR